MGSLLAPSLNDPEVRISRIQFVAAALAHFRIRTSLGFSDCLMLEIARKAGHAPMGTFDCTLAQPDGAERIAA